MRLVGVVYLLLFAAPSFGQVAQTASSSDPFALSLAQKSMAALTGGVPVNDVTLNANVISVLGAEPETGTATFQAKGTRESRVDLAVPSGTRAEVRSNVGMFPTGAWAQNASTPVTVPQHNTWTDAAWFFPALSSLSQVTNPQLVFSNVGQEQHNGVTVQHIRSYQVTPSGVSNSSIPGLSVMDFYLDPNSYLPMAVAFNLHSDTNMGVNIPVEIRFANYQAVNGVQIPFHFQRVLNGSLVLDATVTNVAINTGLQDSSFTLQ